jgi:hypothetical protein
MKVRYLARNNGLPMRMEPNMLVVLMAAVSAQVAFYE